jgi:hypothetical protein
MNPERTYLGVTFPQGVTVTLPPEFPPDHAQHLLDWGWERVEEPVLEVEAAPGVLTEAVDDEDAEDEQPAVSTRRAKSSRK